jgi:hypothetical protein
MTTTVNNKLTFVTFSSLEFLPKWNILYKSIKKFHPESDIYLFGFNNVESTDVPGDVIFEKLSYISNMSRERPLQILKLFDKGVDRIVHLGSDCELFAPLTLIQDALDHVDMIFTPHLLAPLPFDGKSPSNQDIHLHGHINGDFMAIKNTTNSRSGMEWLAWVLNSYCVNDPANGMFYDQSWLNFLPYFCNKVLTIRNKSFNVSYWNVHLYGFKWDDVNKQYLTDSGPLVFMHYSGFREDYPALMSKYQNRHVAVGPILKVYQEYADKLKEEKDGI